MSWLVSERRRLDRRRERLALEWAALKLTRLEKRLEAALKGEDASGHEHKPPGPGGGQFTGPGDSGGGGTATADEDEGSAKPARPATTTHERPKQLRAAGRYRNPARRRRVIAAVKVEAEVARGVEGFNLPDSEPADVVVARDADGKPITTQDGIARVLAQRALAVRVLARRNADPRDREQAERLLALPCHFVEVKTLLVSRNGAVHMSKPARKRKERWQDKYGATFHVVAVDRRRGGKHSGHEVHVAAGELAGTFRLQHMDKVGSFGDVLGAICPECRQGEGKAWLTSWRM